MSRQIAILIDLFHNPTFAFRCLLEIDARQNSFKKFMIGVALQGQKNGNILTLKVNFTKSLPLYVAKMRSAPVSLGRQRFIIALWALKLIRVVEVIKVKK